MSKARTIIWAALIPALSMSLFAQEDVIRTGTNVGVQKVRIAVPDFEPSSTQGNSSALLKTFDDTLFSDLENAGIFDVVSKSFIPATPPGNPQELCAPPQTAPAPTESAWQMIAFQPLLKWRTACEPSVARMIRAGWPVAGASRGEQLPDRRA